MKFKQLLEDLEFHDTVPFAQPILIDANSLAHTLRCNHLCSDTKSTAIPYPYLYKEQWFINSDEIIRKYE